MRLTNGTMPSEEMEKRLLSTIRSIASKIIYNNDSLECEPTPEDETFEDRMKKFYKLRGLSEGNITDALLTATKKLYDDSIFVAFCQSDSNFIKSTYEDLVTEQADLMKDRKLPNVTDEFSAAAVDALQSRVVMMKCNLGCKIRSTKKKH